MALYYGLAFCCASCTGAFCLFVLLKSSFRLVYCALCTGAFYLFVLLKPSFFRLLIRLSFYSIIALPDSFGYILLRVLGSRISFAANKSLRT